jgi:hypothetical protein
VTRGDNGHAQFNASEVFGSATAAAISTYSYHPKSTLLRTPTNPHFFVPSDRTLRNAANVLGDAGESGYHHDCCEGILAGLPQNDVSQAEARSNG